MTDKEDNRKTELFKAFHEDSILGNALDKFTKMQNRLATIKLFYDTDDIFRREIDALKNKAEKKKVDVEKIEEKVDEFLKEAEYRRYIASFEHMKQNYEARKKEMTKIKDALK